MVRQCRFGSDHMALGRDFIETIPLIVRKFSSLKKASVRTSEDDIIGITVGML